MDRVPILKIGDVLLVSIQIDLQDQSVLALHEDLAEEITRTGAHGVVIDISAVEIVDSFIGRMFATIASTSRLFDADTVVVGMRPAVAITLVELGLTLGRVRTALDLEKGLAILRRSAARRNLGDELDDSGEVDEVARAEP
ncbi:MAG TPA: STAS domain-containing protein [Pseudonocardiaceae bacterium]|jgi:rsbT antagonist protein RsbS|nr:STAS domain-containing protein [Pseudonocardiaceae bacterium]